MSIPQLRRGPRCARESPWIAAALSAQLVFVLVSSAVAGHVPVAIDVPGLWVPVGGEGYLEFINPTEHPALIGTPFPSTPPGFIMTEEHTGFTSAAGVGIYELGDGDVVNGDTADFDWVQEHRPDETAGPPISNHPGMVGAMGWTPGSPELSPHVDPGGGGPHGHSVAEVPPGVLPELLFPAYGLPFFEGVDVFSQITSIDLEPTARDAALDYEVAFGNTILGTFSPGIPTIVFVPGWTGATGIDDYVARWVPAIPGPYNMVAIEPLHDDVTEIDAIMAWVPEPSSVGLTVSGALVLIAVGLRRRKR